VGSSLVMYGFIPEFLGYEIDTRHTKIPKTFALLCFSSLPVSLLIPALRGLSQKRDPKKLE